MQCRCPLCGGLTQIPSDLVNYLVRCDACGNLLKPIVAPKENGRDSLKAEPAGVGRVREMASSNAGIAELLSPPAVTRRSSSTPPPPPATSREIAPPFYRTEPPPIPVTLDEIPAVSISEVAALAAITGQRPLPQRRRSTAGIVAFGTLGAILVIGAIIGVANFASPSAAKATPSPFAPPAPAKEQPAPKKESKTERPRPQLAKVDPKPVAPIVHEPIAEPAIEEPVVQTNQRPGDLFPEVK